MNTVLVTAGGGQIGDHICSGLLKKGNAVIAVDTKDSGYNTGKDNFTFVEGAPTDKNVYGDLFENNHIDMLVHAAFTLTTIWDLSLRIRKYPHRSSVISSCSAML